MVKITAGNVSDACQPYRGWLLGHFVDPKSPLHTRDLEIKWGKHKEGESRGPREEDEHDPRTTLGLLISGKWLLRFPTQGKEFVLENEGDYLLWQPNTPHRALALEDSFVLPIRWPSAPQPNPKI